MSIDCAIIDFEGRLEALKRENEELRSALVEVRDALCGEEEFLWINYDSGDWDVNAKKPSGYRRAALHDFV